MAQPPVSAQQPYYAQTQATSPTNPSPYAAPPAKRQRLSPDARSPPPQHINGNHAPQGGHAGYGNSYAQHAVQQPQQYTQYHQSPHQSPNSFNSPAPFPGNTWQQQASSYQNQQRANAASPSSSQMMPPPPKPVREEKEEKVGVDDINDALFSSGVNLKDEENYMHNMYNSRHTAGESFASAPGASFSSSGTQGSSFQQLSQGGNALTGTIGGVVGEQDIEQELRHKRTAAARHRAEMQQHELNNPFLLGNVMRMRLQKLSTLQGAKITTEGLYIKREDPPLQVAMNGSHTEGIVAAKAESCIEPNSRLVDIMSLLSLATAERVRGLLDESYVLARARRYGDNGRVPLDFKDVATGSGLPQAEEIIPDEITGTSWDQLPDGVTDKPHTSISFQSALNNKLRVVAKRDQEAEKARVERREARRKVADATPSAAEDVSTDVASAHDANLLASAAAGDLKVTKKELARQQKEKATISEAQAATSTNQTAAMMALGKKGKKYSWMAGGAASMPTNRYAKATPTTSTPGSGSGTPTRKDARTPTADSKADESTNGMTWGDWRESTRAGQGIQVRDWLLVLERDGKQKRAWERTVLRLNGTADDAKTK